MALGLELKVSTGRLGLRNSGVLLSPLGKLDLKRINAATEIESLWKHPIFLDVDMVIRINPKIIIQTGQLIHSV